MDQPDTNTTTPPTNIDKVIIFSLCGKITQSPQVLQLFWPCVKLLLTVQPVQCAVSCLAQLTSQWEICRQQSEQSRLTARVSGPVKPQQEGYGLCWRGGDRRLDSMSACLYVQLFYAQPIGVEWCSSGDGGVGGDITISPFSLLCVLETYPCFFIVITPCVSMCLIQPGFHRACISF